VVADRQHPVGNAAGVRAGRIAALGLLVASMPACAQPITSQPTSTPLASNQSAIDHLQPIDWLRLGPYGVGNLGCDGQEVAWSTSTQPISKQNSRNDVIEVASKASPQPKLVVSATHGGDLTDSVPITGSWLVYLEYQQHQNSASVDFWYLNAVDWVNGQTIELAGATQGAGLGELPWYDAANGRAVWNQLDSAGKPIIRMHDFTTGATTTLPLPSSMYPVQPTTTASSVIFVDNSTDPDRAHEDFFGRRGSLRRFDLTTQKLSTLSSDSTAWMPEARGNEVVWTAMPSGQPPSVSAIPLGGGTITMLGSNPVAPQTDGSIVVWYDSHALTFMEYGLQKSRLVELHVGSYQDPRSVAALCGKRLFFALPPAVDGGTSTIRYVDLPS
jgi:hypothetical protein